MSRTLLWSCVFFGIAAMSLGFLQIEPYMWSTTIPGPNASRKIATIEYTEPEVETSGFMVIDNIITMLQIEYTDKIYETQSAQINVQVQQLDKLDNFKRTSHARGPKIYSDAAPRELPLLATPVQMSLESPDFDFGQDKNGKHGNDRYLTKGSPLPTKLTWSPTPRRSGQATLLLRLKNVRSASLVINGKPQKASGNDDLPLPINILTELGISRSVQDLIAKVFAAVFGAGGLLATFVGIVQWRRGAKKKSA
jgi:hypothetical protein